MIYVITPDKPDRKLELRLSDPIHDKDRPNDPYADTRQLLAPPGCEELPYGSVFFATTNTELRQLERIGVKALLDKETTKRNLTSEIRGY